MRPLLSGSQVHGAIRDVEQVAVGVEVDNARGNAGL